MVKWHCKIAQQLELLIMPELDLFQVKLEKFMEAFDKKIIRKSHSLGTDAQIVF